MLSELCVWVDADGCPNAVKDVLFKAAEKRGFLLTLVANHSMQYPKRANIRLLLVPSGFDQADNFLLEQAQAQQLCISSDIPLANDLIAKGVQVLTFRGQVLDKSNIAGLLSSRDMMAELRDLQLISGGSKPFAAKEKQQFANALDSWLTKASQRPPMLPVGHKKMQ